MKHYERIWVIHLKDKKGIIIVNAFQKVCQTVSQIKHG